MGAQRRYSSGRDGSGERVPQDIERWKGGSKTWREEGKDRIRKEAAGSTNCAVGSMGNFSSGFATGKVGLDRKRNRTDRGIDRKRGIDMKRNRNMN